MMFSPLPAGTPRSRAIRAFAMEDRLVPHTGFEPVISALRGRCPGPLDECGPVGVGEIAWPTGMIPVGSRAYQTDGCCSTLQPVRVEEGPNRIGDLLEAVFADDEAVVGVCRERLVAGVKPLRESF